MQKSCQRLGIDVRYKGKCICPFMTDCYLYLDISLLLDSSKPKRKRDFWRPALNNMSFSVLLSFFLFIYNTSHQLVFTHLVGSCEGQQFQVQQGPMQINHFILREIIYDVLRWLRIQSPPCFHCHVPCLGLSSVFIRLPAPVLPPLSPESRFIPQIIDYDRLHANREVAKCD